MRIEKFYIFEINHDGGYYFDEAFHPSKEEAEEEILRVTKKVMDQGEYENRFQLFIHEVGVDDLFHSGDSLSEFLGNRDLDEPVTIPAPIKKTLVPEAGDELHDAEGSVIETTDRYATVFEHKGKYYGGYYSTCVLNEFGHFIDIDTAFDSMEKASDYAVDLVKTEFMPASLSEGIHFDQNYRFSRSENFQPYHSNDSEDIAVLHLQFYEDDVPLSQDGFTHIHYHIRYKPLDANNPHLDRDFGTHELYLVGKTSPEDAGGLVIETGISEPVQGGKIFERLQEHFDQNILPSIMESKANREVLEVQKKVQATDMSDDDDHDMVRCSF